MEYALDLTFQTSMGYLDLRGPLLYSCTGPNRDFKDLVAQINYHTRSVVCC